MKEALERMDSALLFAIGGEERAAREQFDEYRPVFEENLQIEQGNITLPGRAGDGRRAGAPLRPLHRAEPTASSPCRRADRADAELYFGQLLPTFQRIKDAGRRRARTSTSRTWRTMDRRAAPPPRRRSG